MVAHIGVRATQFAMRQARDLFGRHKERPDEWAIGIAPASVASLLAGKPPIVRWVRAPEGRFFADPCLVSHGSTHYIFCEEYDCRTRHGRIAVIETKDFETFSDARPVLEQPFHLSYPCVFVHEHRCYCVPEQHQSGEVALYEALDFPGGWVKRASLLTGFPGVDPTVFRHDGRWWMFATNRSNEDVSHLYLFFTDRLLGPWLPHPQNPVRSERHKVRPAGVPFLLSGRLVRPAQDCSQTYGGHVRLQHVTSLTTTRFEEQLLGEIRPQRAWPFADGLHTIAAAPGVTIFDAKRSFYVRNDIRQALRRKARVLGVGRDRR
jgi:hypothetical protein